MATSSPMCAAASRTSATAVGVGLGQRGPARRRWSPARLGVAATSRRAIAEADATASMQPTLPQTQGSSGPPRTRTCPMSPAAPSAPWCSLALPGDQTATDARADLHEEQRRLVRGQCPRLAERAQVDVVLQDRGAAEPALQPRRHRVGVPAGHDRRPHRDAEVAVDRSRQPDHHRPGGHLRRPCARSASQPGLDGVEHRLRAVADVEVDVFVGDHLAGSGRPPRGGRRARPRRRAARVRRAGRTPAGRRAARVPASDGYRRSARTPRLSSSSTAALTVVRAMPAAGTRSALLCAAPDAISRATVLSVTSASTRAAEGGALSRSGGSNDGVSITARFRRKISENQHYSVVVRHWSTLLR